MKIKFNEISELNLSKVSGGINNSWCRGRIEGRILKKYLLRQKIVASDYICH